MLTLPGTLTLSLDKQKMRKYQVNHRKVTIKEIANEAGVSTQTVSRVINNRPDVAPATRHKVQSVIDRWHYQPSQVARSLTRGTSNTIGVVISGLPQIGPSKLLTGIEENARTLGFTLTLSLISETREKDINQAINQMLSARVDGLLWASVPREDDDKDKLFHKLSTLPIPVVVNGIQPQPDLSFIEIDNYHGGKIATQHLIDQGYKKIGIITGEMNEWSAKQRFNGWRDALRMAGRSVTKASIFYGDWTATCGATGIATLWQQLPDLDALFVSNDQMALGVLNTVYNMGKQVPTDLGVVGFDNTPESEFYIPPLTTVQQNMFKSAQLAVSELNRLIKRATNDQLLDHKVHIVNPELIVRDSS